MPTRIPKHIAIIMDGNRRWARSRGLPGVAGHSHSRSVVREIIRWCMRRGVKVLTLFAFSTENWRRPRTEVQFLMRLFRSVLRGEIRELHRQGVRYQLLGRIGGLSDTLQREVRRAMELTSKNSKLILNTAINYGGRAELVDAVKKIIERGVQTLSITEETISRYLYTAGQPDPDLIIRTSGEHRLSGFLLWQSAYAELYFTPKHWPDITAADMDAALHEYQRRQRRYGL